MIRKHVDYYFGRLGDDNPAGIVVFLVALPLCLGIALASGAPAFSGVIAGVVGGLVVAWASGSQLSVSGPAAGLTVIVSVAIGNLGAYEAFLLSVTLAGLMQMAAGYLRAGVIGAYFPSAVIKGMLAAIGIILIMKQIPPAVGYAVQSDLSFLEEDNNKAFFGMLDALNAFSPACVILSIASMAIMLAWETPRFKRHRLLALTPGPLVAVLFGIGFHLLTSAFVPSMAIDSEQLVMLPSISGPADFLQHFSLPDFSQWMQLDIYVTAATLAVVGSLETLLSLEAVDKLDPLKRTSPTNQELKAQGLGNLISGLLGGLPITAVIVRSSASIDAGARTKMASFIHGVLLLLSVMFLSQILNLIPLACLAAILLLTGYKLAKPALFKEMHQKGFSQFAPFIVTILAILLTDLLKGMAIGMVVGIYFVLRTNYQAAITLSRDGNNYLLRLQKDVSFLNKASLRDLLASVEENSYLIINGGNASFIDHDILETLRDFIKAAGHDNIKIELKNLRSLAAQT